MDSCCLWLTAKTWHKDRHKQRPRDKHTYIYIDRKMKKIEIDNYRQIKRHQRKRLTETQTERQDRQK